VIDLGARELDEIAVLGAHCDDIAIGMGGTLLTLARAHPGLRVHALVLSGAGTEREAEERAALAAFCPEAELAVTILDVPDGRAPEHWNRIKNALSGFRQTCDPDVVFATQRNDAHQDHRALAELVPTEFRDHLTLGYEILKWETDTPTPNVYHPLDASTAEQKVKLLHTHYPSQLGHDWFDELSFLGLSRLRGVQCRSPHAEAFVADKLIVDFGTGEAL
jgi:LmbE family N-acetylglucosaminyl deacetylase